jgi:hypothetical protein
MKENDPPANDISAEVSDKIIAVRFFENDIARRNS